MTSRPATLDSSPFPGFPPREPTPPAGCQVCGDWARQRAEARAEGDKSRVSDMNVLMRRHCPPGQERKR